VSLQLRGIDRVPRENALAETGSKSLDLLLDSFGHVDGAAVGNVTVRPAGVPTRGCPRRIDQGLLRNQHKRSIGRTTAGYFGLGTKNFLECAARVNRGRAATFRVFPRNRLGERPIDLENTGAVSESRESIPIASGQLVLGDSGDLLWTEIKKDGSRGRQLLQAADGLPERE